MVMKKRFSEPFHKRPPDGPLELLDQNLVSFSFTCSNLIIYSHPYTFKFQIIKKKISAADNFKVSDIEFWNLVFKKLGKDVIFMFLFLYLISFDCNFSILFLKSIRNQPPVSVVALRVSMVMNLWIVKLLVYYNHSAVLHLLNQALLMKARLPRWGREKHRLHHCNPRSKR